MSDLQLLERTGVDNCTAFRAIYRELGLRCKGDVEESVPFMVEPPDLHNVVHMIMSTERLLENLRTIALSENEDSAEALITLLEAECVPDEKSFDRKTWQSIWIPIYWNLKTQISQAEILGVSQATIDLLSDKLSIIYYWNYYCDNKSSFRDPITFRSLLKRRHVCCGCCDCLCCQPTMPCVLL